MFHVISTGEQSTENANTYKKREKMKYNNRKEESYNCQKS